VHETLIVSSRLRPPNARDHLFAATPLDAILQLERTTPIRRVVLADDYAADRALASFLAAFYPGLRIELEA
jgi:hypothetical protein